MSTTASGSATPTHDPTRTTSRRRRLSQNLSGRTRDVRGATREAIEQSGTGTGGGSTTVIAGGAAAIGGLAFLRSLGAFRQWLARLFDEHVLEPTAARAILRGAHWTSSPIQSSYETGLRRAQSALRTREYDIGDRQAAAVITDDIHQEALAREFERAYYDIEDAIANTQQEVSRAIADGGYIDGDTADVNTSELASTINERIDANHGKRLDPLANSIPVRAANRAAVEAYKRAGVEQVGVEPEADVTFQTSEDRFVCEECKEVAADNPYPLSEVPFPTLDTHLRCRCLILPL